jgi:hypothetical protein
MHNLFITTVAAYATGFVMLGVGFTDSEYRGIDIALHFSLF